MARRFPGARLLKRADAVYARLMTLLLRPVFLREAKYPPFPEPNERAVEYAFAFRAIAQIGPGTLLDVGTGRSSFPHLVSSCGVRVTAIDRIVGYWSGRLDNRHIRIRSDDITKPTTRSLFDMITCVSVLEHIPDHRAAVKGMFALLAPGGHVVMSFPYCESDYRGNIYSDSNAGYGEDYRFVAQVFSRSEIEMWTEENCAEVVCQEYFAAFTGEFWTMGEPIHPIRSATCQEKHHLSCVVLRRRVPDAPPY